MDDNVKTAEREVTLERLREIDVVLRLSAGP